MTGDGIDYSYRGHSDESLTHARSVATLRESLITTVLETATSTAAIHHHSRKLFSQGDSGHLARDGRSRVTYLDDPSDYIGLDLANEKVFFNIEDNVGVNTNASDMGVQHYQKNNGESYDAASMSDNINDSSLSIGDNAAVVDTALKCSSSATAKLKPLKDLLPSSDPKDVVVKARRHFNEINETKWNGRNDCSYATTEVYDKKSLRLRSKNQERNIEASTVRAIPQKISDRTNSNNVNIVPKFDNIESHVTELQMLSPIGINKAPKSAPSSSGRIGEAGGPATATNSNKGDARFTTVYMPSSRFQSISDSLYGKEKSNEIKNINYFLERKNMESQVYVGSSGGSNVVNTRINESKKSSNSIDKYNTRDPLVDSKTLIGVSRSSEIKNMRGVVKSNEVSAVIENKVLRYNVWYSELVKDVYDMPVILSLLISDRRVELKKLINLKKYDKDSLVLASFDNESDDNLAFESFTVLDNSTILVPEKVMVKAYDPINSVESKVQINMKDYLLLLYDLKSKFKGNEKEVLLYYQPLNINWWTRYLRIIVMLRPKPNNNISLSISKISIESIVRSRIKDAPLPNNLYHEKSISRAATASNKEHGESDGPSRDCCKSRDAAYKSQSPDPTHRDRSRERAKSRSRSRSKSRSKSPSRRRLIEIATPTVSALSASREAVPTTGESSDIDYNMALLGGGSVFSSDSKKKSEYSNGVDTPTDPFKLEPIIPDRITRREKVARAAIARARDGTTSDRVFRNRKLSDIEISLFGSPFAQTFIQPKIYKNESEKQLMDEFYQKAEDNEINRFGRELTSSDAFRLRSGLKTREKDRAKVHFVSKSTSEANNRPASRETSSRPASREATNRLVAESLDLMDARGEW